MDGTIITKRGMQLLVKLMATKGVLTFTRVAIGTGSIPNGYDPASMIELVQYKMDGVISKCSAEEDVARITMQVSSVGIETGFIMTEMGVFASDPDIGEILYAYLDMKEDPQYIYAEGGETQKFVETTLEVAIEHATKVSTYINPSSLITKEDFDAEIEKIIIPEFDDSGEVTGITNFPAFLEKIKSKMNIFEFFKNLKAGLQFVLHTGQIVNNCVSDNPELPLSAAQGKILMDLINQTNGNLGKTLLSTSILQKALELPNNGFFVYNLNGANYNGNDLPVGVYSYGSACIYKRNSESIFVFLTGIAASSTPLATNWYDGASWTGWKTYVTNTDLQNYPKTIQFNIPIGLHVIIKEGDNRFAQLLFLQASNMNGQGIYGLSGYGEGGSRYFVSNISPNDSINIEIIGTTFKITNNFSNIVVATLTKFMGDTPTIQ